MAILLSMAILFLPRSQAIDLSTIPASSAIESAPGDFPTTTTIPDGPSGRSGSSSALARNDVGTVHHDDEPGRLRT